MEFLNIGVLEFLFILLLVFIVLGPKKAVETARQVGGWIRDVLQSPIWRELISTSNEIRDIPKKLMDDAEMRSVIKELDQYDRDINQRLRQKVLKENSILSNFKEETAQSIYPTRRDGESENLSG